MKVTLNALASIALEAGGLFTGEGRKDVSVKGYADFVTATDIAVQTLITRRLRESFPDSGIISEESEERPDAALPLFVLDPVDGTTNLIHRMNTSCVALGYCLSGTPVMGVVYNPFTEELFTAERGCGAYLNGKAIRVSATSALKNSLVAVGTSPYRRDNAEANMQMISRVFNASMDFRRCGSSALDICSVADGRCDAFAEADLKPWDFCAASVVLAEAGGRLTDWRGQEPDMLCNQNVLATNSVLHGEMLQITSCINLN